MSMTVVELNLGELKVSGCEFERDSEGAYFTPNSLILMWANVIKEAVNNAETTIPKE